MSSTFQRRHYPSSFLLLNTNWTAHIIWSPISTVQSLSVVRDGTGDRECISHLFQQDVYMIRILYSHSTVQRTVDDPHTFFDKNHIN